MKKPTSKMLEIMERIAQGGQVHWDPFFCNSVDAHSSAVASMLRRGLVRTQPGTRALALTDKGKAEITVNSGWRRRMTITQEERGILQELEELEAKATGGKWEKSELNGMAVIRTPSHIVCSAVGMHEDDAKLVIAVRNALPELLQKAQQLDAAEARAVEAERQRDNLAKYLGNRDKNNCPPHPSNQCYLNITSRFCNPYNNNAQGADCWLKWAAQKDGE